MSLVVRFILPVGISNSGEASLWLLRVIPGVVIIGSDPLANLGLLTVAAAFGAVLPDLDAQDSYLKRLSVKGVAPFVLPAIAPY